MVASRRAHHAQRNHEKVLEGRYLESCQKCPKKRIIEILVDFKVRSLLELLYKKGRGNKNSANTRPEYQTPLRRRTRTHPVSNGYLKRDEVEREALTGMNR